MAQICLHGLEKTGAWTGHPLPGLSGWRSGGNMPRGCESTEVIQPNYVCVSQQNAQPIDAPAITNRTKGVPVVNRIAPQLSLRAEIVGRNAGDEAWPTLLIEKE